MWLMAAAKEGATKEDSSFNQGTSYSLPKDVTQLMGLSVGSSGWTAAVGPQGAAEVTNSHQQLLEHQQKVC